MENIISYEGRLGSICYGFCDTVFDRVETIDDDLLVDFADFGLDMVLQCIEGPNLVTPCIHCQLQTTPVALKWPQV